MMMMMMSFSLIYTFIAQTNLINLYLFIFIFYLNGSHKAFLRNLLRKRTRRSASSAALSDSQSVFLRPLSRIVCVTDVSLNSHAE
jgi:hypothetical protein